MEAMNQIIEDVGHQKHKKKPWLKEFVNLTQQPFIKVKLMISYW